MITQGRASEAKGHRLLSIGIGGVFLVALGVFAYLASVVDRFPGELSASLWVQSWRASWLDTVVKAISAIPLAMLPVLGVTVVVLYLKRWRKESLLIAATIVAGFVLMGVIKEVVARPRPSADLVQVLLEAPGYSFPSGTAMGGVVVLGTLMVMLTILMKPGMARGLMQGAVVLVLLAIGFSRVYLGAHWLGDVIGGYAFGAALVTGAVWLWWTWIRMRDQARGS